MSKILFIMTGSDHWTTKNGPFPTGFWAEEAVVPQRAFRAAGHTITVATPDGVVPPPDPTSLSPEQNGGEEGAAAMRQAVTEPPFTQPIPLKDVRLDDYDAVFVPGGLGPMEDLAVNHDSGRLLARALQDGKPVAVLCHGPASLLTALDADGRNAFAGYRITSFTKQEEEISGTDLVAKWLMQDRLAEAGLTLVSGAPWTSHVVVDRNVVSGQNPQSSAALAEEFLKHLN